MQDDGERLKRKARREKEREVKLAHMVHAKLSEVPEDGECIRLGVSVHGIGNEERCQTVTPSPSR